MPGGDASIRTTGRLTESRQRHFAVDARRLLQTQGGSRIEEAVGQHPDMQCTRETREHRAEPGTVSDHGRQRVEFCRYAVERLSYTRRRGSGQRGSGLALIEIGQQIIELTESALVLDFRTEAGSAATGIAFESGDGSMLILDHAGDRAEGAVGNVPCDRASELPRRDPPGLATWSVRDRRRVGCAEQVVEMVAEVIELADDLGREVVLANRSRNQNGSERREISGGCHSER